MKWRTVIGHEMDGIWKFKWFYCSTCTLCVDHQTNLCIQFDNWFRNKIEWKIVENPEAISFFLLLRNSCKHKQGMLMMRSDRKFAMFYSFSLSPFLSLSWFVSFRSFRLLFPFCYSLLSVRSVHFIWELFILIISIRRSYLSLFKCIENAAASMWTQQTKVLSKSAHLRCV